MKKITGVLLCIAFFMSCSPRINPAYKPLSGAASFDKEGHRGCRGLLPENTIPAFLRSVDLGVTTIELDVVISKDKQVVVSHDPFFHHEITTKPNGDSVAALEEKSLNLYGMTYEQIKTYDVGLKPHPRFPLQQKIPACKPLLSEVIDSVTKHVKVHKRQPVYYNIEAKCTPAGDDIYHPRPEEFIELLMGVIKEKKMEEWVIIQSFDIRTLQYLHKNYPGIKTSLLVEDERTFALQLKDLGFLPNVYSPECILVTPLLVKQCHDAGVKIIPWTVNDMAEIEKLVKLGVDGIITDYPDLFQGKLTR